MNINVGTIIFKALSGTISTYPVIAEEQASTPFAVYRRMGVSPVVGKCGYRGENAFTVEIIVADANYTRSINKAQEVIDSILATLGSDGVIEARLENSSEDYADELYTQRMTFVLTVREQEKQAQPNE